MIYLVLRLGPAEEPIRLVCLVLESSVYFYVSSDREVSHTVSLVSALHKQFKTCRKPALGREVFRAGVMLFRERTRDLPKRSWFTLVFTLINTLCF